MVIFKGLPLWEPGMIWSIVVSRLIRTPADQESNTVPAYCSLAKPGSTLRSLGLVLY